MVTDSILTLEEQIKIENQFQELLQSCSFLRTDEDRLRIRKAFDLANEAHKNARRRSGEPYIIHPLCVAKIVVEEIGLGSISVMAALLHDVVEDTDYTLDFIRQHFGDKVAMIVDGLTKISGVFNHDSSLQIENFKKMMLTISDDVRVIMIKLADRLHNMRTLGSLPADKQIKIAGETMFLYAPLAHRMGMNAVKQELEDLSLFYRHPKDYKEIEEFLHTSREEREKEIEVFIEPIRKALVANGYKFEIKGRPKSIYSIYHKIHHKNVSLDQIYDLSAIRIIFEADYAVPEKKQCWDIYSLITDIYSPKHDRIRDWVSTPKSNGYEALHITVMSKEGKWVEVQIRSRRMDDIAEKGIAAHMRYKGVAAAQTELDRWIKNIVDSLAVANPNAFEFMDELRMNLFATEIQVFTPKGKIITIPKQSVALDFAYAIHTEVGDKAMAAKINHKLQPLDYVLSSGDIVEILTSESKQNHIEYIQKVATSRAKYAIKNMLKPSSTNSLSKGKEMLDSALRMMAITPSSRLLRKLMEYFDIRNKDEFYSKIGAGILSLDNLDKILKTSSKHKWLNYWKLKVDDDSVSSTGGEGDMQDLPSDAISSQSLAKKGIDISQIKYTPAPCCSPIPGDDVIGSFTDDNKHLIIHKTRCYNAVALAATQGHKVVAIHWETHKMYAFLTKIFVQGLERQDIYAKLIFKITEELNVSIRTLNLATHDGIFEGNIELYVHNIHDLELLLEGIKNLRGIRQVYRVESEESNSGKKAE